jgi:hypothetical protein
MRFVPFSAYLCKASTTPRHFPAALPAEAPFTVMGLIGKPLKMHATNVGPHLGTIKTDFC